MVRTLAGCNLVIFDCVSGLFICDSTVGNRLGVKAEKDWAYLNYFDVKMSPVSGVSALEVMGTFREGNSKQR